MSKETEMYRNPDAPVGYVIQENQAEERDHRIDMDDLAFLLKELEDFVSDSDSDTNIDHFKPNSDSEESSEEVEEVDQNDAPAEARKNPVEEEARKRAAPSTSSSRAVSTRSREKKKESKFEKSPKKSKRERHDSGSSDSSVRHLSSRYRPHHRTRSPSPVTVKQEMVPEHLFGCYHCDVCNLTLNSKATYDSHVIGKRHKKALNKVMNIVDTVARSVPATEVECKKPMPAPGITRTKVRVRAFIQDLADSIDTPLPGLHYVTEIRSFSETSYYCALCNAPCSGNSILPHLKGFKHMLKSLKMYKPDIYDQISYKQKYQIEDKVRKILMSVEKTEGRGFITVEEDKLSVETGEELVPTSFHSQPSTSQVAYMDFTEYYDLTTIPDTSKSGYYCKLCEAHMNSLDMWENHISGRRHTTNARKMPGSIPSKIKNIPMKDVRANLMDLLQNIDTPVVGLNHIRETQNRQTRKDMYQCYLCGACLNTNDIVEHVVSHKHRVRYLQEIRHECLHVVKDMDINGANAFAIVEDACARIEAESGRGKPLVFFSKDFFPPNVV